MKKYMKKLTRTIVLMLKLLMYLCLLGTFLLLFSFNNHAVLVLSRTMGTTILTFCIVGLLMTAVYGHYDIGRRKSKPIIYSVALAAAITDVIAYVQLMIMNTITPDVKAFKFSDIGTLVLVILVQTVIVALFAYVGNAIYFAINEPEKVCIITKKETDLTQLTRSIKKYKKQYQVCRVVDYRRTDLGEILAPMDTVVLYDLPPLQRNELVNHCYEHMINIYFNPEIPDVIGNIAEHYLMDDVSFLNANVGDLTIEQRMIKRFFDIILAVIAGVISSPFWIVSAIAIKLGDGGSVLFKQKRATKNGRVFMVYKFRTMKENVENRSATTDDDRITKVGRFLRKVRLDELPQILNILKGDMSFVGPRPEMMENVDAYTADLPEFKYRLRVKGGLTGYAQIAGKYNTTPKDKLILDMMYIENYSIWNDVKLLFQTAIVLFKSDSTEGFQKEADVFRVEETPIEKQGE